MVVRERLTGGEEHELGLEGQRRICQAKWVERTARTEVGRCEIVHFVQGTVSLEWLVGLHLRRPADPRLGK